MEDLQVLTQTWSGPLVVAMQILLILLVAWLLQRMVRRTVTRIGERYPVPPELLLPLRGGLRWLIMVSALIMVLERLGVSAEVLWTALTGFAAVAAVAFFAIWSVLSNLFCYSTCSINHFPLKMNSATIDSSRCGRRTCRNTQGQG